MRNKLLDWGFASALLGGGTALHAQSADADHAASGSDLTEIVVVAQKRSERLQDVPLTVTALSGSELATGGVSNIEDLQMVVPGLQVGNSLGVATPHLRGVGSTTIGPGIESPIAVYVDGVYYAATSSDLFDFVDVKDVEVLKGPQGTLFGRNATGGLINVTTKDPTQDFHLDADIGYGNYQTGKADFLVSGGVTSTLTANFAMQVGASGQGYGRNFVTGEEVGRNDISYALRSKWLWTPGDSTRVMLIADYSHQLNSYLEWRVRIGDPNLPFLGQPAPYGSPWDQEDNVQPQFADHGGGISLKLEQDVGFANLVDIVAYRRSRTHYSFDLDGTAAPFQGADLQADQNQFSEELQLSSKQDDTVRWTGGLYYFHSGSQYDPSYVTFDPDPALNPGFNALSVNGDQTAQSVAGYGQATVSILPQTNLTLGARYTYEKHTLVGSEPFFGPYGQTLFSVIAPPASKSFDKPTYRASIDHHVAADTLLYVSYTTGFKSGGFNTQSIGDPPYQPETLGAAEIGVKSELLERRLLVDLSGFHYSYKNIQVQKVEGAASGIINGASATMNGIDLDLKANITNHLSLDAIAEYLDAHFNSFPDAPLGPPPGTIADLTTGSAAGFQLPFAPREVFTITGNYSVNLSDSNLLFSVTVNHSGSFATEPDNVVREPSYSKVNSTVRWSSADQRYQISLWGRNLFNAAVVDFETAQPSGLRLANYEPPRTYGITFSYHL